jgi:3-oxoacyl-[acyl-carrier protein] reductase
MSSVIKETALVTGAAQGIGLSIVERLASEGFKAIAVDVQKERVEEEAVKLRQVGHDVTGFGLDVCDRRAVAELMSRLERIDVVVCAAGVYWPRYFMEATEDDFRKIMEVNLIGVFVVAQEAVKRMKQGGRVILISSRGALGGTGFPHYVASKAAVIGLTRAMAMELRKSGIMVNSVAPGFTDTPMTRSMPPDQYAAAEALESSGRAADPKVIANAVAFFSSPLTQFVTGQVLYVDGGKSLGGLGI